MLFIKDGACTLLIRDGLVRCPYMAVLVRCSCFGGRLSSVSVTIYGNFNLCYLSCVHWAQSYQLLFGRSECYKMYFLNQVMVLCKSGQSYCSCYVYSLFSTFLGCIILFFLRFSHMFFHLIHFYPLARTLIVEATILSIVDLLIMFCNNVVPVEVGTEVDCSSQFGYGFVKLGQK